MKRMRIKDISEKIGVHPATIRRWEEKGLVKVKKSHFGQRVYDDETILRLKELAGIKGG